MLLPLLMNLNMFTAPLDKGRDAGSGRAKQWWQQDEIVIPGVTHYVPPKDITPLRPKLQKAKETLKKLPDTYPEIKRLRAQTATLTRSVNALEARAAKIIDDENVEIAIDAMLNKYREVQDRVASYQEEIAVLDATHQRRLANDEDFLMHLLERI